MSQTTLLFHRISYLQYPCMIAANIIILYSLLTDLQSLFYFFNQALVLMGLGISFSTLQDTTTTQNEFSKRIWQDPVKGKRFIIASTTVTFLIIFIGIIGLFLPFESVFKQISIGLIALGIGLIGMVKAMIEMFENHRLDKNPKHAD